MPNYLLTMLCCMLSFSAFSQQPVKGIIADSSTRHALPFATVRSGKQSVITGINGQFALPAAADKLTVSYTGYTTRNISTDRFKNNDTIFLAPLEASLDAVIIKPDYDKVKRIVNTAIRNKSDHNPEMYDAYQCNIYYKMKTDLRRMQPSSEDSARLAQVRARRESNKKDSTKNDNDSGANFLMGNNHLLFSETYSKRLYKKPGQLQEVVQASRFSGLKKTYFTSLVTNVLPFHMYNDFIQLNGRDYSNPISKGWQQRYDIRLADEIINDGDTTYILKFSPKKNVVFNSLKGMVYINTKGYAITHFIGAAREATTNREMHIEQICQFVNGRWFPKELNFDLFFDRYPSPELGLSMNGHSVIDSVLYVPDNSIVLDKAHNVKLSDSVDLRSEADWQKMRPDSITQKERNTYVVIDSFAKKRNIENIVNAFSRLAFGRFPLGKIDLDISRLLASNDYEGTRLGLGIYTNDKISKYFSAGGWFGYGFRDKAIKYGGSLTIYPKGNKEHWLQASYQRNYQSPGNVSIHPDLDRSGLRNWLLAKIDRVEEYAVKLHTQLGYWQVEPGGRRQQLLSLYDNNFIYNSKNILNYTVNEASLNLRYAYGEKRVPVFDYYVSSVTKYPIFYLRTAAGTIESGTYKAKYVNAIAAITFSKHFNRWGKDNFRLEGGLIHAFDDQPIAKSFLLAGNGFRRNGINYYQPAGFTTLRVYDFFSDRYISFLYKHDFDKYLWQNKLSKPYISIAHNLMYGGLKPQHKMASAGIQTPVSGYHETGIILNQLLQRSALNLFNVYFNAGVFYHWESKFNWERNGVIVMSASTAF